DEPETGDLRSIVRTAGVSANCNFLPVLGGSGWIPFSIGFSFIIAIAKSLSFGGSMSSSESSSSSTLRMDNVVGFVIREGVALLSAPGELRLGVGGYSGECRLDRVVLMGPE